MLKIWGLDTVSEPAPGLCRHDDVELQHSRKDWSRRRMEASLWEVRATWVSTTFWDMRDLTDRFRVRPYLSRGATSRR